MISPKAEIDPKAKIGKNVTIYPFAYIEGDVEIGDDCVISTVPRSATARPLLATRTS